MTIDEGLSDPRIMELVRLAHSAWCAELRRQGRTVSAAYEDIVHHPKECLRLNVASVLAVLGAITTS